MQGATLTRARRPVIRIDQPRSPEQAVAVSVLIPVFNEEQAIGSVLREVVTAMDAVGKDYEILIVDDGSTDRTVEVVRAAAAEIWSAPIRLVAGSRPWYSRDLGEQDLPLHCHPFRERWHACFHCSLFGKADRANTLEENRPSRHAAPRYSIDEHAQLRFCRY